MLIAYLLGGNGLLASLVEFLDGLLVITQILLTTDENNRETAAEMKHFGNPLRLSTCQPFIISYLRFEIDGSC